MIEVGKRIAGRTIYIPHVILTESVPGAIYELEIRTKGIPDEKKVVDTLREKMPEKFKGLEVLWIKVDGSVIRMQVMGSPFSWGLVLLWLPEILQLIGVIVTFIAVFLVISQIPTWAWATLLGGVFLIYAGPKIGSYIRETVVGKAKEVWKEVG